MISLGSVWATGQSSPRTQLRQGPYVSATAHDTDRVPPAIARLAIDHLTAPGDTVLDPDCGAGTVPVEALGTGCHAIAITDDRRWWSVARANLTATRRTGTHTDALLLDGTPCRATGQLAGATSTVDLLLTSLRPTPVRGPVDALRQTLRHCRPLMRSGAHAVVVLRTTRDESGFTDPLDGTVAASQDAGLDLMDHCIALDGQLRADRWQSVPAGAVGIGFHDVLIFRVPDRPVASTAARKMPRVRSTKPLPATSDQPPAMAWAA